MLTEKHYTPGEFAKKIHVDSRTLQRWDKTGKLPAHRDLDRVPIQKKMYQLPTEIKNHGGLIITDKASDRIAIWKTTDIYHNIDVDIPYKIGSAWFFHEKLIGTKDEISQYYIEWLQARDDQNQQNKLLEKWYNEEELIGDWKNIIYEIKQNNIKNIIISQNWSRAQFVIGINKLYHEFGSQINYWNAYFSDMTWESIQAGIAGARLINPKNHLVNPAKKDPKL